MSQSRNSPNTAGRRAHCLNWGKSVSLDSLRRLFKVNKLSYKRICESCRHLRAPVAYEFFRTEVGALRTWAASGEIDLCYCDEMGVN